MDDEVGSGNDGEELPERIEGGAFGEEGLDGDGPLGMDVGGDLLALAAEAGQLEFLVGVGGVVEPLPGQHVEQDDGILGEHWNVHVAQVDQVLLDKIGIVQLGKAVMMTVVVLDIPCLRHHPV